MYAASGLRGDALLEAVVHSDVSSWRIAKVLALYLEHQNAHSSFCSLKEKPLEKLRTSATVADTYLSGPLDHPITRFPRSHTMPLAAHYETVVAKKALRDDLYLALKVLLYLPKRARKRQSMCHISGLVFSLTEAVPPRSFRPFHFAFNRFNRNGRQGGQFSFE